MSIRLDEHVFQQTLLYNGMSKRIETFLRLSTDSHSFDVLITLLNGLVK
jgi:hypothetical protein